VSETADIIVVGAGVIGTAIARELGRRGAAVRVFEGRTVGAGATQASAGVLAPFIEAPRAGPLLDLAVRSLDMYDTYINELLEEAGVDVEYRRCGTLEVAVDDAAAEGLQRDAALRQLHVAFEWLDQTGVRGLEPALPEAVRGALFIPIHGYVSARQLIEALSWAALRHGVVLETGRRIAAIQSLADCVEMTAEDGTRWSAAAAVLATGTWVGQLGVDELAARSVRPVRGQLIRLGWRTEPIRRILWGRDCYIVPNRDGSILVGATVEEVGFDERTTAAGVRDLLDAACEFLPVAWGATFEEARVGLRPATSDGLPIIGPSVVLRGVTYATGHYRNGILLAPVTASLVSDWVLESRVDPLLEPVFPARFDKGDRPLGSVPLRGLSP
jgi:glycine oxidase